MIPQLRNRATRLAPHQKTERPRLPALRYDAATGLAAYNVGSPASSVVLRWIRSALCVYDSRFAPALRQVTPPNQTPASAHQGHHIAPKRVHAVPVPGEFPRAGQERLFAVRRQAI